MSKILRIPLYFFGFVALTLLFGYITFKILSYSRSVEVPDLRGKSLLEANEALNKNSLYLKIEGEEFDSSVPAEHVMSQDEPSGVKVKENRAIKVIISKGPKIRSVPLLIGESLDRAEFLLSDQGLHPGRIIYIHSNSVEKNFVIAQKPEPDEKFVKDISLIVSSGHLEPSYYMPDFQGMEVEEVRRLADRLGLKVELKGEGEKIKSQKPSPASPIKSGETIYLTIEGSGGDKEND